MNKKVLLVADDDEMGRRIIGKFLKGSYEIVEAINGREAWEILCSTHIDAVLLDIIMPEMDGLEVLANIRADRNMEHIGVLVASSIKERTERTALSAGADDVVAKPYDPLVIEKRLSNILAMKEASMHHQLMEHQSYDILLEESLRKIALQAEGISDRIQKYVAIINANKDNLQLVTEIAAEIDLEARKIKDVFAGEGERRS